MMAITTPQSIPARVQLTMPGLFLRIEGVAVFVAVLMLYAHQGLSWLAFILLFLVPDLSIVTFSLNKRWGSIVYNLIHTYALPMLLAAISLLFDRSLGLQLALIWLGHIALDRAIGYGLKYLGQFKNTHLSHV
ncbi:MAG: DUF4260 domain-containing protein [Acaryochloridaceae cyanobacterium RU_4_10]|nr:DUF4260 domain-containing protein [Acaryochloridaceae cyanobacterium RU_4_10]